MTTPAPASSETSVSAPRPLSRAGFKRMSPAAKYTALVVTIVLLIIIGQLVVHSMTTEPRDARMIADRELNVNVVEPGEKVLTVISVVQRNAFDYFRATRGVLALTSKRIVFLGLRPRDMLAPSDAPPAFEQRDFPLDTAVSVTTGRAMAMLTKGVILKTPDETLRLSVPTSSWPEAQKLAAGMTKSRERAHAEAKRQQELEKAANEEWKRAVAEWHKAQYHTVRRGDALGSIATQWNTTAEHLMELNKMTDNRIRVGATILVREAM
jgi:LysM repeat protein